MAHMTQTQTSTGGTPDPDRNPDPDPGPDDTRTRTGPDHHPDSDPDRSEVWVRTTPGPQTQTQTGPQTRTVGGRHARHHPDESGPDDTRTQTQTQTVQTRTRELRDWMGRGGYLTALTAIVAVVAAIGQKVYAEETAKFTHQIQVLGFDLTPWFAPFVFDLAVAALLHGGIRAARDRFSPWPWWIGGAVVAGLSIYTNSQHDGAQITASASAGLFLIWGLYLHNQYIKIVRSREVEDSASNEMVSTDVLFTIDRRLADRARLIARTKPMAAGLAYRHRMGEVQLNKRDLAIQAARLYIDIFADELYALLNPHRAARPAAASAQPETKVRWYHRGRRNRAYRLARMTAEDTVDRYLGLPVPERRGVVVARVTYAAQDDTPLLGAVTATAAPALPVASAAAPAAPALPAARTTTPAIGSAPHRRADEPRVRSGHRLRDQTSGEPPIVVVTGQPSGLAGQHWMPLDQIPGLPQIDPSLVCHCHREPAKWCGRTLVEHVQRRGRYVHQIVTTVDNWDTRPEKIGKALVKETCDLTSAGVMMEVSWLFDQLRVIAQARLAEKNDAMTVTSEVIEP